MLVAVVGVAFVGTRLARAWPREVAVQYRTASPRLDVDVVQDGEAVSSARLMRAAGAPEEFAHTLSLPPGDYDLELTTYAPNGEAIAEQRTLSVPAEGLVRFDLAR